MGSVLNIDSKKIDRFALNCNRWGGLDAGGGSDGAAMKKYCLLSLAVCTLLMSRPAGACTGLVVQDGERVLVGNNEDWFNPRAKIWFILPAHDRYGSVFFGFDNFWPQGGMNQKGLFFDAFALKPKTVENPEAKPRYKGNLIKEVMATCGTVKEALALIDRYSLDFMNHFQLFIADATGDAAIVEGNAVVRKQGAYQVVTNFRQSETGPGEISCPRYRIVNDMLQNCRTDKMGCVRNILAATHQEEKAVTLYSNIYDLKARRVHVYYFHNFQDEVVIDLEATLAGQPEVIDLPTLFPPNRAAQAFMDRFTRLKKTYFHEETPRFTVRYPAVYEADQPLDDSQVFLAWCRYGRLPALTVDVTPAEADRPLSRVGSEVYAPRLRKFGKKVRILSNRPVRLADGSEAYETRITWRFKGRISLHTIVLSAERENKLVNAALHHTGELDYLQHIPYSLRFE